MTPSRLVELGKDDLHGASLYKDMLIAYTSGVNQKNMMAVLSGLVKTQREPDKATRYGEKNAFLPFLTHKIEDHINFNGVEVTAGAADPSAGSGGVPASSWNIDVTVTRGRGSTALSRLERYFRVGHDVYLFGAAADGSKQRTNYTVLNATAHGTDPAKAVVTIRPNVSDVTWSSFSAAQRLPYQPTEGIMFLGANCIHPAEAYDLIAPADMSQRLDLKWSQFVRSVEWFTDLQKEQLGRIFGSEGGINPYLSGFRDMKETKYLMLQKQHEMDLLWNTIMWGQRFEEQTEEDFHTKLEKVIDPKFGDFWGWKTKCDGLFTQMSEAGCEVDFKGGPFDLDLAFYHLDNARRYRSGRLGQTVDKVQLMVNTQSAQQWATLMTAYQQAKYPNRIFHHPEKGRINLGPMTSWRSNIYEVPGYDFELEVIANSDLDDTATHFQGSLAPVGNMGLAVDWNMCEVNIYDTKSRDHVNPSDIDPSLEFRVDFNQRHVKNTSRAVCPIVKDPRSHVVFSNYDLNQDPILRKSRYINIPLAEPTA